MAYFLACIFENEVVSARKYESIRFGLLGKVIKVDKLVCVDDCNEVQEIVARVVEHMEHDRAVQ